MTELKHYRCGGTLTHSGVEVLPGGKPINVTIQEIKYKEKEEVGGQKKDGFVAYSRDLKLPIFLNATNKKRLAKLAGTDYLETVKNITVTLCAEECRDAVDGGMTKGLRISKIKPAQGKATMAETPVSKPALVKGTKAYEAAIAWLMESDSNTCAALASKYEIEPETLAEITTLKSGNNGQ